MSSHMRFNNASARSQKKQAVPQAWKRESGKLPSRNGAGNAGWQHQMPCTAFLPTWARCHVTSSWLLTSTHESHPVSSSQATLLWGCSSAWGFFAKQQQSFLTPASCLQELLLNDIVTSTLWHNFWGCFPHLSAFPSSSSAFPRYRGSAMVSSSAMRAPTTKGMNSALS